MCSMMKVYLFFLSIIYLNLTDQYWIECKFLNANENLRIKEAKLLHKQVKHFRKDVHRIKYHDHNHTFNINQRNNDAYIEDEDDFDSDMYGIVHKVIKNQSINENEKGDLPENLDPNRINLNVRNGNDDDEMAEFDWKIPNFIQLLNSGQELKKSPKFYVTEPGYRLQMLLIPNTTYTDNSEYIGIFFRLVTGIHDSNLTWPYQCKSVLKIKQIHQQSSKRMEDEHFNDRFLLNEDKNEFTLVPNTDPCRLRSAFLRPSMENDQTERPDGCGNRRHLLLRKFLANKANYLENGTLTVTLIVYLKNYGQPIKEASMKMRYNNLVSEYIWSIDNFTQTVREAKEKETVVVISSEPFYTHSSGYLMQLFMTLLPKKNAFALSTSLGQGDYDRYLQWPYPYEFEVAIIDDSPEYWRRDYSVHLIPSTSECTTSPFFQPTNFPEFCFVSIQSLQLLSLPHYHFVTNHTLKIRFTNIFTDLTVPEVASLQLTSAPALSATTSADHSIIMNRFTQYSINHALSHHQERRLYSEYSWLISDIEVKLYKFDFTGSNVKMFKSKPFYSYQQGYLAQMILTFNTTTKEESFIGIELSLLEGKHDKLLNWPFNLTYELVLINQGAFDDLVKLNQSSSSLLSSSPTFEQQQSHPSHQQQQQQQQQSHLHSPFSSQKISYTEESSNRLMEKDLTVQIKPSEEKQCSQKSFAKPIEKNPPCGRKHFIKFPGIKRSLGFKRLGHLLIKCRIYL